MTSSWQLAPGSDLMATCVGVLPKVAGHSAYEGGENFSIYAGLVTLAVGAAAPAGEWYLAPADTPLTYTDCDVASSHASQAPGVYVAVYYSDSTGTVFPASPPYAFPEGWTPGNTTGSGPVLPYLGLDADGHWPIYAGLVEYVAPGLPGQETSDGTWYLAPVDTPLTYAGANAGAGDSPASTDAPQVWMAVYYPSSSGGAAPFGPPPTALPTGWTFRPYGLGPVAITDENAGGLIGDVAYVVSGYVFNSADQDFVRALGYNDLGWFRGTATYNVEVGDVFRIGDPDNGPSPNLVTQAGTAVMVNDNYSGASTALTTGLSYDYWPFIERFDLANKKWLPRIPLPRLLEDVSAAQPWTYTPALGDFHNTGEVVTYGGAYWECTQGYFLTLYPDPPSDGSPVWKRLAVDSNGMRAKEPFSAEGGIAGVIDGKLYFGGGDGLNITGQEFFVYDPADDSVTRLADIPVDVTTGFPPDYNPYGVAGGKLWALTFFGDAFHAAGYDPVAATWSSVAGDVAGGIGFSDQVQGFEINGKLWFVYSYGGAAFVFDPMTLTVEAKATGGPEGSPYLIDGKIYTFALHRDPDTPDAIYDPAADTWTTRTDIVARGGAGAPTEFVGVTYHGIPYALSAVYDSADLLGVGVYYLSGPAHTAPPYQHLVHLGFTSRQALLLQGDLSQASFKDLIRAGFSPWQARTLKESDLSLKSLLHGGFTTYQAKALEA